MTVASVYAFSEEFLTVLWDEGRLLPNTLTAYRGDLRQFEDYLREQDVPLLDVMGMHIRAYITMLSEKKNFSSATIVRKLAAIGALYNYLKRTGQILVNPLANVAAPMVVKAIPQFISVDDVNRLLHHTKQNTTPAGLRDRAMFHLVYATGMRVSELVALDLSDLDTSNMTVRCVGRGNLIRSVSIDEVTMVTIQEYLDKGRPYLLQPSRPTRALFLNHRSQRLTRQGFWLVMRSLTQSCPIGARVTPHTLRHSFAVHRLRSGMTLKELSRSLGHFTTASTQVYHRMTSA